jgi:hypothetical protein
MVIYTVKGDIVQRLMIKTLSFLFCSNLFEFCGGEFISINAICSVINLCLKLMFL